MPKIVEYDSPEAARGLQPNETGVNSALRLGSAQKANLEAVGRTLGGVVSNLGTVLERNQKQQGADEVNKLQVAFAQQEYLNGSKWDAAVSKANGNDTSFANDYIQQTNDGLDQIAESATTPEGKAYAAKEVARQKLNTLKTVHADTSRLAADASVANIEQAVGAKTAFVHDNPEQLDAALAQVPDMVGKAIVPGATGAEVEKARTESVAAAQKSITIAALQGMAEKNPQAVLDMLQKGQLGKYAQYVGQDGLNQINNYAQAKLNANQRTASAAATAREKQQKSDIEDASVKILSSLRNPDGSVNYDAMAAAHQAIAPGGDFLKLPGLTRPDIDGIQSALDKIESGEVKANKDDKNVIDDLEKRMTTTDGTQVTKAQIFQAEVNGHITANTRAALIGEYEALHPTDHPGPLDNAVNKQQYDQNLGLYDPEPGGLLGKYKDTGDKLAMELAQQEAYQSWYRQSFINGINAGLKPEDLLFPQGKAYIDPHKYTGPGSADLQKRVDSLKGQGAVPPPITFGGTPNAPAKPVLPRDANGVLLPTIPGLGGK